MNRHAIALAADSAITVKRWVSGKEDVRSFKGANKIFQLSNTHPVGLMIFDTASLHEVPWEIIVKDFRGFLGDRKFGHLEGYAQELFSFITYHYQLFPRDYQIDVFEREATKVGNIYLKIVEDAPAFKSAANDQQKQQQAFDVEINQQSGSVAVQPIPKWFSQNLIIDAVAAFGAKIETSLRASLNQRYSGLQVNMANWVSLSITSLFKNFERVLEKTGIVVGGYGDENFFPGFHEYECYGLLLGTLLVESKSSKAIDMQNPAAITAFATTDMVEAFLHGISNDVYGAAKQECNKVLSALADFVRANLPAGNIPNLDPEIQRLIIEFQQNLADAALSANYDPLIRVIGSLPVDEMASLAETLIMIESVKEKVTKPTESVGGPIDVAVISKGDGFVWIKRKHYFDPEFNPRFFKRQGLS